MTSITSNGIPAITLEGLDYSDINNLYDILHFDLFSDVGEWIRLIEQKCEICCDNDTTFTIVFRSQELSTLLRIVDNFIYRRIFIYTYSGEGGDALKMCFGIINGLREVIKPITFAENTSRVASLDTPMAVTYQTLSQYFDPRRSDNE